jgi:hypothetical protein
MFNLIVSVKRTSPRSQKLRNYIYAIIKTASLTVHILTEFLKLFVYIASIIRWVLFRNILDCTTPSFAYKYKISICHFLSYFLGSADFGVLVGIRIKLGWLRRRVRSDLA